MKKLLIVLNLLLLCLLVSCQKKELLIDIKEKIEVGEIINLNANYENVTWESSDDSVCEVVQNTLKGISEGNAIITCKYKDLEAKHKVEVIEKKYEISIKGISSMLVGETYTFSATSKPDGDVLFKSSDESILEVSSEGVVKAKKVGTAKVIAYIGSNNSEYEVIVKENVKKAVKIKTLNSVEVGKSIPFGIETIPQNLNTIIEISDESIITIKEGFAIGLKEGITTIKVYLEAEKDIFEEMQITCLPNSDRDFTLSGKEELKTGEIGFIEVKYNSNIRKDLEWEVSDKTKAIINNGYILALACGEVIVKATLKDNQEIFSEIKISISEKDKVIDEESIAKANELLSKMTLNQKLGQMFVTGFTGTYCSDELISAINEYNFGNIIYMGYNVNNPGTIFEMSQIIQECMIQNNLIRAFIATDQEGGRVARLTNGATHFISNMALGATGNYKNSYNVGLIMGKELLSYGINTDFAPVLDVNNNYLNPVIGVRSYSDNPIEVALYGTNMIKGLKEANVLAASKHFPGHGNTSVDSHYGLPMIETTYEELLQMELAPFISAINAGIDSIMTTHIIFSKIDNKYPATLSQEILQNILREKLGFEGLIITDSMEMNAITKYFGSYDETSVKAVLAGADILTYTGLTNAKKAYQGLYNAVIDGVINTERIDESVRRILLKKIKQGLLEEKEYSPLTQEELLENEMFNNKLAMESLTLLKGDFKGLDKTKKTLIVSNNCSFDLSTSSTNTLGSFCKDYFAEKGYMVDTFDINKVNQNVISELNTLVKKYDAIVLAFSNVQTKNETQIINLVNTITKNNNEFIVIGLDSPYDIMCYDNISIYINVYGYQKASCYAISRFLNGEFKACGKSPIKINY